MLSTRRRLDRGRAAGARGKEVPSLVSHLHFEVCCPCPLLRRLFCEEQSSGCIAVKCFAWFFPPWSSVPAMCPVGDRQGNQSDGTNCSRCTCLLWAPRSSFAALPTARLERPQRRHFQRCQQLKGNNLSPIFTFPAGMVGVLAGRAAGRADQPVPPPPRSANTAFSRGAVTSSKL